MACRRVPVPGFLTRTRAPPERRGGGRHLVWKRGSGRGGRLNLKIQTSKPETRNGAGFPFGPGVNVKPHTLNLTPQTPKPKPYTQNPNTDPKPCTPNPKPQTLHLKPQTPTPNPKPQTPNPKASTETRNPKPQLLKQFVIRRGGRGARGAEDHNWKPQTPNYKPSTQNSKPQTLQQAILGKGGGGARQAGSSTAGSQPAGVGRG